VILLLFGEDYLASAPILRVMGAVMATRCMMVALQLLLSSIGLHAQRVASLGVAVAFHIAANAILIPRVGALAAAFAALACGILVVLLYAYSSSRGRGFSFLRWFLVPSIAAAALLSASYLFEIPPLANAGVSVCVFILILFATGFVRLHELRFVLRSVASPRR